MDNLWYHIHGGMVHFPIAAAILSFVFDFGGILFRKETLRAVGFWLIFIAATAAVFAVISGLLVTNTFFTSKPSDSWEMHRNGGYVAAGLLTLLALWRGLKRDKITGREFAAYMTAAAMAAAVVGFTGFMGGKVIMYQ